MELPVSRTMDISGHYAQMFGSRNGRTPIALSVFLAPLALDKDGQNILVILRDTSRSMNSDKLLVHVNDQLELAEKLVDTDIYQELYALIIFTNYLQDNSHFNEKQGMMFQEISSKIQSIIKNCGYDFLNYFDQGRTVRFNHIVQLSSSCET